MEENTRDKKKSDASIHQTENIFHNKGIEIEISLLSYGCNKNKNSNNNFSFDVIII